MQRYWLEIERCAQNHPHEIRLQSPFGTPEFPIYFQSRWRRMRARYLSYPLWTRFQTRDPLVHILDHSSAHLIPWIPRNTKVVVTVHDLIPLRYQGHLTDFQLANFHRMLTNMQQADHLVAVSEFTKQDIQDFLHIPGDKISVVLNGVEPIAAQPALPADSPVRAQVERCRGTQCILTVGSTLPRKNLESLPGIFRELDLATQPVTLWRVGHALPPPLRQELEHVLGAGRVVEFGFLPDDGLDFVYRQADLLIFPSLLEGFGLPVIEALARDCPVVSSNTGSLPEAGGDAVLYYNPYVPAEAVRQINRLRHEPQLRAELTAKGQAHIRPLTWERHFQQLLHLYQSLIEA